MSSSTFMAEVMFRQIAGGAMGWLRSLVRGDTSDRAAQPDLMHLVVDEGLRREANLFSPITTIDDTDDTGSNPDGEFSGAWEETEVGRAAGRFYGDGTTIHSTGTLDVEVRHGEVVAVWYRCQMLPFTVAHVDGARAYSMREAYQFPTPRIAGVYLEDADE